MTSALTEDVVLARGGWHPRYARVLAVASDGDYGFAVVDGNGDGAELEAEAWERDGDSGGWEARSSSGAGPLGNVGPERAGGTIGPACFTYGRAPGQRQVTISFDGQLHHVPVGRDGIWAFVKVRAGPDEQGFPARTA
jgi:hypothetical protein